MTSIPDPWSLLVVAYLAAGVVTAALASRSLERDGEVLTFLRAALVIALWPLEVLGVAVNAARKRTPYW